MLFFLLFHPLGQFNCSISAGQPVQAPLPRVATAKQTSVGSDGEKHTTWSLTGAWGKGGGGEGLECKDLAGSTPQSTAVCASLSAFVFQATSGSTLSGVWIHIYYGRPRRAFQQLSLHVLLTSHSTDLPSEQNRKCFSLQWEVIREGLNGKQRSNIYICHRYNVKSAQPLWCHINMSFWSDSVLLAFHQRVHNKQRQLRSIAVYHLPPLKCPSITSRAVCSV